jgi:hypothetical protein
MKSRKLQEQTLSKLFADISTDLIMGKEKFNFPFLLYHDVWKVDSGNLPAKKKPPHHMDKEVSVRL